MSNVQCKNCGSEFPMAPEHVDREVPCRLCHAPVAVPAVPAADLTPCPHCARPVPVYESRCAGCGQSTALRLAGADEATQRARLLDELDALAAAPGAIMQLDAGRGWRISGRTIAPALFGALCSGALLVLALATGGDATGRTVILIFSGILGLIFGGMALGSWLQDRAAWNIAGSDTPERALARWLMAVRTTRAAKSWACVAPHGRANGALEPVAFTKIRRMTESCPPGAFQGFRAYWKALFRGEAGETRYAVVKRARVLSRTEDGFALLAADVEFTSYPSWIIFLFLINILALAIGYLATKKRETATIRKLLVYRHQRWWVAEPGWEGALDRARLVVPPA